MQSLALCCAMSVTSYPAAASVRACLWKIRVSSAEWTELRMPTRRLARSGLLMSLLRFRAGQGRAGEQPEDGHELQLVKAAGRDVEDEKRYEAEREQGREDWPDAEPRRKARTAKRIVPKVEGHVEQNSHQSVAGGIEQIFVVDSASLRSLLRPNTDQRRLSELRARVVADVFRGQRLRRDREAERDWAVDGWNPSARA